MPQIKVATFNAEWMVSIFGGLWNDWAAPDIPASFPGKHLGGIKLESIDDVPMLCKRIADVIDEMQADIIGIQEGPPLKEQMEAFVNRFLPNQYTVFHSNSRWQSITCLVKNSIAPKAMSWTPNLPGIPDPWSDMCYYPWGKIELADRKSHGFDRHPLLLSYKPNANIELNVMIVHTKSKYSLLKAKEQWDNRDEAAILDALSARAKLSAEAFRLREILNLQLAQPNSPQSFVVMGDFNDGPFAELIEREFMLHNIVDEMVGSVLSPDCFFKHAMTADTLRCASTTHFPDPLQGGQIVEELIDHILLSPAIWQNSGDFSLKPDSCQVESVIYNNHFADTGPVRKRDLRPSDHKPVSAIFEY